MNLVEESFTRVFWESVMYVEFLEGEIYQIHNLSRLYTIRRWGNQYSEINT